MYKRPPTPPAAPRKGGPGTLTRFHNFRSAPLQVLLPGGKFWATLGIADPTFRLKQLLRRGFLVLAAAMIVRNLVKCTPQHREQKETRSVCLCPPSALLPPFFPTCRV